MTNIIRGQHSVERDQVKTSYYRRFSTMYLDTMVPVHQVKTSYCTHFSTMYLDTSATGQD